MFRCCCVVVIVCLFVRCGLNVFSLCVLLLYMFVPSVVDSSFCDYFVLFILYFLSFFVLVVDLFVSVCAETRRRSSSHTHSVTSSDSTVRVGLGQSQAASNYLCFDGTFCCFIFFFCFFPVCCFYYKTKIIYCFSFLFVFVLSSLLLRYTSFSLSCHLNFFHFAVF